MSAPKPVRIRDFSIIVLCPKCENWRPVTVRTKASLEIQLLPIPLTHIAFIKGLDVDSCMFLCRFCQADIAPLLEPEHIDMLIAQAKEVEMI